MIVESGYLASKVELLMSHKELLLATLPPYKARLSGCQPALISSTSPYRVRGFGVTLFGVWGMGEDSYTNYHLMQIRLQI